MTANPPQSEDDKEADARFNETLGRLVNTPHTPRAPIKEGREPKPAPKAP